MDSITCTENFAKFGDVVYEIRKWADRHTDTLTAMLRIRIGAK